MKQPTTPQPRKYTTDKNTNRLSSPQIVLPMSYEEYQDCMADARQAKEVIEQSMKANPELFPSDLSQGYKLNGWTEPSAKMPEVRLRRIRLLKADESGKKRAFTLNPCDLLSYRRGRVDDVEKALFLKSFGVPDWALTHVFGRNDSYWYRLSESLGRNSLVGTTVKSREAIPTHLLADEKHTKAHNEKWYIGTTVGKNCVLGASVSQTADSKGLTQAYEVFKDEARALNADYAPKTVNTDGWVATSNAWSSLFPNIVVLLCFLHAFISIRSRCKRLGEVFDEIKDHVWNIYHATDLSSFYIQMGMFEDWLQEKRSHLSQAAVKAIEKMCDRVDLFAIAYSQPLGHRTSNMLDRQMESMARWLSNGRHYHGNLQAAELRVRSWALLHNFRPYCPRSKISDRYHSRMHKLNRFVYRENWLENLLVASSCQGFRLSHKKRLN